MVECSYFNESNIEIDEMASEISYSEPLLTSIDDKQYDGEILSENSKIIYVGHNTGDGDGSPDNPFSNFKLACDNVNGENDVIINVYAGTYYLGEGLPQDYNSPLIFDTNNLNIVGINGSVVIKNLYEDEWGLNAEAFS